MSENLQLILMSPVAGLFLFGWFRFARSLSPDLPMTRTERLVLDAIERFGPDVNVPQIYGYLNERISQWSFGYGSIYVALMRLETSGHVSSVWDARTSATALAYPRRRLYSRVEPS